MILKLARAALVAGVFFAASAPLSAQDNASVAAALAAAQARGVTVTPAMLDQIKARQSTSGAGSVPAVATQPAVSAPISVPNVPVPGFEGAGLQLFGSQLFLQAGRYVTPSDLPVPSDYIVGVGDTVQIRLFGKENDVLNLAVERDGNITIPGMGEISVAGLSLEAMGKLVLERIAKQKIGVEATVSMGPLRSIQVFLMGDVNHPGALTTDALTTVANALMIGGGIRTSGSMRRVEVRRHGKVISQIDLYDTLLKGTSKGELRLQSGDVIFVPTVGKRVGIAGEVTRPAIYELLREKTVDDLVSLAGGFRPSAYPQDSKLNRIGKAWHRSVRVMPLATAEQRHALLQDGDIFDVPGVVETNQPTERDFRFKTVTLAGKVRVPGEYAWHEGMDLGEVISRFDQLELNAYRPLAAIERLEKSTGSRSLHAVNLLDVVNQKQKVPLQRDDRVFVFSQSEVEFLSSANVQEVLAGKLPTASDGDVTGAVVETGKAALSKQVEGQYQAMSTQLDQTVTATAPAPGAEQSSATNSIVKQGRYCRGLVELSHIVSNEGTARFRSALFAGAYDAKGDGKRLVKAMPCPNVFDAEPALLPFLLENAVTLRGEVENPGILPVPPDFSLATALLARGGMTREADPTGIEVNQLKSQPDGTTDVVRRRLGQNDKPAGVLLHAGDIVQIRKRATQQESGLVQLNGEFVHPGAYEIRKGEKLSELITRAGGVSQTAYTYGAVFLRDSVREQKRQYYAKAAQEVEQNLLFAMTRQSASGSAGAGAGAVPALTELINQLKVTDPVGRMVVEADPVALMSHPELDVVLEPGDKVYMPRRPSSILVMGEVLNPGAVQFESGMRADDYIRAVGGMTRLADEDRVFAVLPNGRAQPLKLSSWNFRPTLLPPGSVIYVTREALPTTNIDMLQLGASLVRDLAMTAASLAVIGR